jgi:plastocyanin
MTRPRSRVLAVAYAVALLATPVHAEQLRALVRDAAGKPLPNAVVVAAPKDGKVPPAQPAIEVVDQIDKEFVPYVKPVRVGTQVQFPNKDNIRHHVYSFSPAKKFELPLYRGTPAQPVLFDKVGVVKLGCNIHDWMLAYIYVTDAPYFAKTTGDGRAHLDGLTRGSYRVWVWHPRMTGAEADTSRDIDLQGTMSLEWKLVLSAEFRPPRAPVPGDAGYR